jgi:hypothetical protein
LHTLVVYVERDHLETTFGEGSGDANAHASESDDGDDRPVHHGLFAAISGLSIRPNRKAVSWNLVADT